MAERRSVRVSGIGLLCGAGIGVAGTEPAVPGPVPGFRARDYVADRKSLKLMTTAVRLGVSAIQLALDADPDWASVPPDRRGLFVGASPQPGDPEDLGPALEAALGDSGEFEMSRFAEHGYPLIHPLWLVRGLSNNIIGFASAIHDLQGVNMNYCDGVSGGRTALREGALAIAEGRADLVLAGGADVWTGAEALLGGGACGDGAAFVLLRSGGPCVLQQVEGLMDRDPPSDLGFLGSATWPVALARTWIQASPGVARPPE
jgi:hypothetical protein